MSDGSLGAGAERIPGSRFPAPVFSAGQQHPGVRATQAPRMLAGPGAVCWFSFFIRSSMSRWNKRRRAFQAPLICFCFCFVLASGAALESAASVCRRTRRARVCRRALRLFADAHGLCLFQSSS